jgi:hypothetical protein
VPRKTPSATAEQAVVERLVRAALSQPGVQEVLELHARCEQVLNEAAPYTTRVNRLLVFSSSDSTS